eukprot:gene18915-26785_t
MEVMVAVVEAGSFAAAARQLQISAVMVGKHIQQLETNLGARLFQRSTRSLTLTEGGQRLLAQVGPTLYARFGELKFGFLILGF